MADRINIGRFNRKISVLKPVETRTDKGQIVHSFELVSDVYADVSSASIPEALADNNLVSVERLQVNMFSISGINNSWRLQYEGSDYNILSVTDDVHDAPFISIVAEKIIKS